MAVGWREARVPRSRARLGGVRTLLLLQMAVHPGKRPALAASTAEAVGPPAAGVTVGLSQVVVPSVCFQYGWLRERDTNSTQPGGSGSLGVTSLEPPPSAADGRTHRDSPVVGLRQ